MFTVAWYSSFPCLFVFGMISKEVYIANYLKAMIFFCDACVVFLFR